MSQQVRWYRSTMGLAATIPFLVVGIAIAQVMLDGTARYVVDGIIVVALLFCVVQLARNARAVQK
jgi:hypothetical protein